MAKNLSMILLYDFYKPKLTGKQADMMDLYYNEDLSLAEISEHTGITRQGVRDSIKRAEHVLEQTEERLGLVERYRQVGNIKAKMLLEAEKLAESCGEGNPHLARLRELLAEIED